MRTLWIQYPFRYVKGSKTFSHSRMTSADHYLYPSTSTDKASTLPTQKYPPSRLGTILGFLGMLRPHIFSVIQASLIVLVKSQDRQLISNPDDGKFRVLLTTMGSWTFLDFYISSRSKTMTIARACFPNPSHPRTAYTAMCPFKALKNVTVRG